MITLCLRDEEAIKLLEHLESSCDEGSIDYPYKSDELIEVTNRLEQLIDG